MSDEKAKFHGAAIVFAPVRPGATLAAGPLDMFNGIPLSSFCERCCVGILEIGRTDRLEIELCSACSAMFAREGPPFVSVHQVGNFSVGEPRQVFAHGETTGQDDAKTKR